MSDIFSAISILLVFATIAFDVYIKEAQNFIYKSEPDKTKVKEYKKYNVEKWITRIKLCLVSFFILLLLPKSIVILKNSSFSFWNFDFVETFYIIINFCILLLLLVSIRFLIKTLKK